MWYFGHELGFSIFLFFLTNLLPALKPICWISILEELIQL